jgi:hypothetical protein
MTLSASAEKDGDISIRYPEFIIKKTKKSVDKIKKKNCEKSEL